MKGWSQRQATTMARQRGVRLSLGSLRFLEEGKTKHPDRSLLESIATLYDVPFEMLVQRFVEANYGVGVKVQGSEAPTSANPTLSRVIELESRVAQYQSVMGALRDIVERAPDTDGLPERKDSA